MKRVFAILILLFMIVPSVYGGIIMGGPVVSSGTADGFVGNNTTTNSGFTNYINRGVWCDFVPTIAGTVSFCHVYIASGSGGTFNIGVYNASDGSKIIDSTTQVAGADGWYHFELDSPLTLNLVTTYRLVIGSSNDESWGNRTTSDASYNTYMAYSFTIADSMPSTCTGQNETDSGYKLSIYLDNNPT